MGVWYNKREYEKLNGLTANVIFLARSDSSFEMCYHRITATQSESIIQSFNYRLNRFELWHVDTVCSYNMVSIFKLLTIWWFAVFLSFVFFYFFFVLCSICAQSYRKTTVIYGHK